MLEMSLPQVEEMLRDAWGEEACIEVVDRGSEIDLFASRNPNLRPRFAAVGYPNLGCALSRLAYVLRETAGFQRWQDKPRQEGDLETIRKETLGQKMHLEDLCCSGDTGAA